MTSTELLELDPVKVKKMKDSGSLIWDEEDAKRADDTTLEKVFCKVMGYEGFNSTMQREAVRAIVRGEDVVAIMPTGGGKSAFFEFPAMVRSGTVIVVSPLVSLLYEQAGKTKAALYVSHKKTNKLCEDDAKHRLIFVSPETLHAPKFVRFARDILKNNISMLAVDEAHCIALWGNSFRRHYLNIGRFFDRIGYRPQIIALSATLTPSMIDTVKSVLRMDKAFETYSGLSEDDKKSLFKRENIKLSAVRTDDEDDKYKRLCADLKEPVRATIVFCSFVETVNDLYDRLTVDHAISKQYEILRYHGSMSSEKRFENQRTFCMDYKRSPKNKIMVATNAFGMGIDKQDISRIIFYEIPYDVENYAQEFGRAGRNGKRAQAVLYVCEPDIDNIKGKQKQEKDNLERYLRMERFKALADNIANAEADSDGIMDFVADYFVNEKKYIRVSSDMQKEITARNEKLRKFRFPDELYLNVCPPARIISRGEYTVGEPIINRKDKIVLRSRVDYLDLMIANAVYTYGFNGKKEITAKDVFRLLLGDENAKCGQAEIAEIHSRILRLMDAEIEITRTGGKFRDTNGGVLHNINGRFLDLENNGKNEFVYKSTPPLFKYAEICNGEMFAVDTAWLKIMGNGRAKNKKALDNSIDSIKLTTFIAWRVHLLPQYLSTQQKDFRDYRERGESLEVQKRFKHIRFENTDKRRKPMYEILELDASDNAKKQSVIDRVKRILDYYKRREFIVGYKEMGKKGCVVGVELNPAVEPTKSDVFYFCDSETARQFSLQTPCLEKLVPRDFGSNKHDTRYKLRGRISYFDLMIAGAELGLSKDSEASYIDNSSIWATLTGDSGKTPPKKITDEIQNRRLVISRLHAAYSEDFPLEISSSLMHMTSAKHGGNTVPDTVEHVKIKHFVLWQILSARENERGSVVLKLSAKGGGAWLSVEMSDGFTPGIFVKCTKEHVHTKVLVPILNYYYRREGLIGKYTLNGDEYTLPIAKKPRTMV